MINKESTHCYVITPMCSLVTGTHLSTSECHLRYTASTQLTDSQCTGCHNSTLHLSQTISKLGSRHTSSDNCMTTNLSW